MEYQSLFQFASLLVDTIPKHGEVITISPKLEATLRHLRDHNRTVVVPRIELLKPQLARQVRRVPVRVGVSRVQASNLTNVDWAASQPATVGALPQPLHYTEQNATVARQVASLSAPAPASSVQVDPNDPFAASAAFAGVPPVPAPQSALPAGLPALPAGAITLALLLRGTIASRHCCVMVAPPLLATVA